MSSKKISCYFSENFKQPDKEYIIVSYSLFYIPQYLRHYYKKESEDISVKRQFEFATNLSQNINNIETGFLPKNWYIRIHYDDSIFQFKRKGKYIWKTFYQQYKRHPRVQWVKFNCPDFKTGNKFHKNLFGTLPRLYPLFKNEKNVKMVLLCDADNILTKGFVDEVCAFEKDENVGILKFCSRFEISFYQQNSWNQCFLRMGTFASKIKFPLVYWDFILHQAKTFQDKTFQKLLDNLQRQWSNVFPDKPIRSYKEFEYGMDEIILNHYIVPLFEKRKIKSKIVRFQTNTKAIFNTLIAYFKFNYNDPKKRLILEKILKNTLLDKYIDNFEKNIDSMQKLMKEKIKKQQMYEDVSIIIKLFQSQLISLKSLTLPETLVKFFEEVSSEDYEAKPYDYYFVSLPVFELLMK
jgi:hypothetical protein